MFTFPENRVQFFQDLGQHLSLLCLCYYHSSTVFHPWDTKKPSSITKISLLTENGLLDYSNLSSLPLGKDPSMAVSWFLEIGQYPISSFTQHHFTTAHNLQQGILSSDFRKLKAYHLSHATFLWCLERTL